MARTPTEGELEGLRRHFEIERELADRLRKAPKERRKRLYAEVYAELFRRVEMPGNAAAQRAQVGLLLELLEPLLSMLGLGHVKADLGHDLLENRSHGT